MATRTNVTVAQSRQGRRPMSVSTMLRKEREGTLFKLKNVGKDLGKDLSAARDKTLDTVEDWLASSRYGRAVEDVETIKDKVAGDYGKNSAGYDLQGRTTVQGLSIAIENQPGSVRSGKNDDGSKWETKFKSPYGYIEDTKGADGEEIDAYVGPNKGSLKAFVVHQKKPDGSHDEDTVMLGYDSKEEARADILRHYDDKSLIGEVDELSIEDLKKKLKKADGSEIPKLAGITSSEEKIVQRLRRQEARRSPVKAASEVMQDPYPNPKVEDRQENMETKYVNSPLPIGSVEDSVKAGADQALGDQRKKWEGPTRDDVGTSDAGRLSLRSATGSEGLTWSDVGPVAKLAELENALRSAFLDELQKIAEANNAPAWRGDFEKFASSTLLDDLVKEAIFRQLAGGLKRGLVGGVTPQGIPMKGVLSGLGGVGQKMQTFGKNMATSPVQRMQAAGAGAGEAQQLAQQAQRFGVKAPGVGKRIAGETIQTAGQHVTHSSPLQLAINPVGTVVGGGIEGATRATGRELVKSTGAAGQVGAGGIRAGLGRAMQRHAGAAGTVGEIGTLGALGGMVHLPLSAAGALGSGIAHASPLVGQGLGALGAVGGHVGADALGTLAQKASKLIPHAVKATGKLMQVSA